MCILSLPIYYPVLQLDRGGYAPLSSTLGITNQGRMMGHFCLSRMLSPGPYMMKIMNRKVHTNYLFCNFIACLAFRSMSAQGGLLSHGRHGPLRCPHFGQYAWTRRPQARVDSSVGGLEGYYSNGHANMQV